MIRKDDIGIEQKQRKPVKIGFIVLMMIIDIALIAIMLFFLKA